MMHVPTFRRFLHVAPLCVITLAACESGEISQSNPERLATKEVSQVQSASLSLAVGDTANLANVSRLAMWANRDGFPMTWVSQNPTVASVSSTGKLTARAAGSTRIIVAAKTYRDTLPITVSAAGTQQVVVVTPSTSTLNVGQTVALVATLKDASGKVVVGAPFTWSSTNSAIASVTSSGSTSAVASGSTTISATSGGVKGSASITVLSQAPTPPPPPPSTTVTLPTAPQLLAFAYPARTGVSLYVKQGDNLQNVLNSAKRGDEIVLQAGATFTGNFVLPAKAGTANNGWITIRSDKLSSLPMSGTRVTPAYASSMPKIITPNVTPAMMTALTASGWWIAGVEFMVSPSVTVPQYGVVRLGDGSSLQNDLTKVASDLVLDRVYIHAQGNQNTSRCVELNSARTAIQDSYLADCHANGYDSQAILGWNGPGPFKIVNNTLYGSGENVMFGGADPTIPNLVPSDIEIRRNYIYTPSGWKGVWTKKNLLELKNAQRMVIQDNVFDGSWSDAQNGYAITMKSTNQSGRCTWCVVRDITIRGNIIRNAGSGFGLSAQDPGTVGGPLARVLIEQNVMENINLGAYNGEGRLVYLMNNPRDVTIRSNTMTSTGTVRQFLLLDAPPAVTNLAYENNLVSYGSYGLFNTQYGIGQVALKAVAGVASFKNVEMIGPYQAGYPNGAFASSLSAALVTGLGASMNTVLTTTSGIIIP